MFWRKNKPKKKVICPITVITKHIEDDVTATNWDTGFPGFEIKFKLNEVIHKAACYAELGQGSWGKEKWHSQVFYLDDTQFDSFLEFKENAKINDALFFSMNDIVEVTECERNEIRFPWYKSFEPYVVIEEQE